MGTDIEYEVCNRGKSASTFFWSGARFGVDTFGPLIPNYCVHRVASQESSRVISQKTDVLFSGGVADKINTRVFCRDGGDIRSENPCSENLVDYWGRVIQNLSIIGKKPDGIPYSIGKSKTAIFEGGSLLEVTAARNADVGLLLVFPDSNISPEVALGLIANEGGGGIQVEVLARALLTSGLDGIPGDFEGTELTIILPEISSFKVNQDGGFGDSLRSLMIYDGIAVVSDLGVND